MKFEDLSDSELKNELEELEKLVQADTMEMEKAITPDRKSAISEQLAERENELAQLRAEVAKRSLGHGLP